MPKGGYRRRDPKTEGPDEYVLIRHRKYGLLIARFVRKEPLAWYAFLSPDGVSRTAGYSSTMIEMQSRPFTGLDLASMLMELESTLA